MDGLHADAAPLIIFKFGCPHPGLAKLIFDFPALAEALDQVADAGLGNGVPAVLEAAWIVRVHGDEADRAQ